jgi:autotransporter family porin
MHRILRVKLIVGLFAGIAMWAGSSNAQYTLDFQTNLYVGIISNWPGSYIVGSNTIADVLLIKSGGTLSCDGGYLGYETDSSNNTAVVTGTGSVWKAGIVGVPNLYVGYSGAGNSLVISNRGRVSFSFHYIGYNSTSSNNSVLVSGAGSVWSNTFGNIYVGNRGNANSLIVSNGGLVVNSLFGYGYVGMWGSNNVVVITGSNSTWKGNDQFYVGGDGASNSIVVENGGQLISAYSEVGVGADGAHNRVVVSGSGSAWTNTGGFTFGYQGGDNNLVITNGGAVFNGSSGFLLGGPFASDNKALVAGTGSLWSTTGGIFIGSHGDGNSLVISNGGRAVCSVGSVGSSTGNSNSVLVTGSGSTWNNGSIAYVGNQGSGNSVTVAGGSMLAAGLVIGSASVTCDNFVQLDSGNLIVTNATHDAVLEVRNGMLILNGGLLQVDNLVMTNACGQFIHNGGTIIAGNLVLGTNAFRVTSIAREGGNIRVTWLIWPGQTNVLQATTGGIDGSYATNGFTDVFAVTGAISFGSVANYLDVGAATNFPARYYRVRLVP